MNDVTDLPGLTVSTAAPSYLKVDGVTVSCCFLLTLLHIYSKQFALPLCAPDFAKYTDVVWVTNAFIGFSVYL